MKENIIKNLINNLGQDRNLWGDGLNWANWRSELSLTSCTYCKEQHGKIVDISIFGKIAGVLAHPNCKCVYVPMRTKTVGTATDWGMEGADAYIYYFGHLPDYYVDKQTALEAGWFSTEKKFSSLFPGKMLGGDVFNNSASKLPSAPGRTWYSQSLRHSS